MSFLWKIATVAFSLNNNIFGAISPHEPYNIHDSFRVKDTSTFSISSCDPHEECTKSTTNLKIPIFPLRKYARMPTDSIELNLWEERYIALSETVLRNVKQDCFEIAEESCGLFGLLYCSDMPQMVRSSSLPITPMVKVGDVGAICIVSQSNDETVPKFKMNTSDKSESDNGEKRRRINLVGMCVGRFRVKKILSDGFGGPSQQSQFIFVEGSILNDVVPEPGSLMERKCVEYEQEMMLTDSIASLSYELYEKSQEDYPSLASKLELASFALLSSYYKNNMYRSTDEVLRMMNNVSTLERLEHLRKVKSPK